MIAYYIIEVVKNINNEYRQFKNKFKDFFYEI